MTIARPNCRAVHGNTARSIAPSRKWTCQSCGRRIVGVSVIVDRLRASFAPQLPGGGDGIRREPVAENLVHGIAGALQRAHCGRIDFAELAEIESGTLYCLRGLRRNDTFQLAP